jgi:hypothetical protein
MLAQAKILSAYIPHVPSWNLGRGINFYLIGVLVVCLRRTLPTTEQRLAPSASFPSQ